MNRAERSQNHPVSWVVFGYRARRAHMEAWDWLERTVTRKIAQVKASGGDFCRHFVQGLVANLCDQVARRVRVKVRLKVKKQKTETVSGRYGQNYSGLECCTLYRQGYELVVC